MSKVKLEVVEISTATMNVKSSKKTTKKILPGVSHALAPALDKYGRVLTGVTEQEYLDIISKDQGATEPLSYRDFYRNFVIKVTESGKTLDLSIPKHDLIYRFLKTCPEVAENLKKVNTSVHTFYLKDEEAEAKKTLSKIDLKMKAYTFLSEMGSEDIIDFLVLYGKEDRNTSSSLAKSKLGELIETDPKSFIDLFIDNNKDIKINVRKLLNKQVLRKEGPAIFYGDEGDAVMLGASEELAIEYLKDVKNQDLYISLAKKLED